MEEPFLEAVARAQLARARNRAGIPQQEQATAQAESGNMVRTLQAMRALQELSQGPEEHESQMTYRTAQTESAQAQAEASRSLVTQRETAPQKKVERTVDYGNRVRTYFTDGTMQDEPKGAAPRAPSEGGEGGGQDAVSMLLQGGTADKLPIGQRAAAVAAARQSGGVDGTGFVPMNQQQQFKYTDFMDLRRKATRLRTLLADPTVVEQLGPWMGRWTGWTKEMPGIGQSTTVKEAFDLFKDLSDTELRRRSGAAISPGEYMRIVGFTVDPTKQGDSNLTNLNSMITTLDGVLNTIGAVKLPTDEAAAPPGGAPPPGAPRRIKFDAQGNVIQ